MKTNFKRKRLKNKKAIVLLSGGLDSTVAAAVAKNKGYDLNFLFLNYGQKNLINELTSIENLKKAFKPKNVFKVKLPWLKKFGGSGLFDKNMILNEKNFILEYVPFRNSIFLSIATALAEVSDADTIFVGSSGGDHICPDNSLKYIRAFQKVINEGTLLKKGIKIVAPIINTDKTGAVKIGIKLKVPFELTWSCHDFKKKACGHCSNCLSRIEAFKNNKISDPIMYQK